jgi:hypothetical protein
MEAREMKTTIDKIRNGSPCMKASFIQSISTDVDSFPSTNVLSEECRHYFIHNNDGTVETTAR